jgi:hypothetical protein
MDDQPSDREQRRLAGARNAHHSRMYVGRGIWQMVAASAE